MRLPKTVAHLLRASDITPGREYADGNRAYQFTTEKGDFFVRATKCYMSPWQIQVGRYRTQAEQDAMCKAAGIQGNVFAREFIHVEDLPKGAKLGDMSRRLNQVWAGLLASGAFGGAKQ